ncbi:hypothetical protein [uncultured Desulfuromusa sp.]|uniref:hypothetical protein n=1 Tax=uncultured Desulfuromusa sp. TaxID=219183 RepID=UPI002AA8BE73|nr:hypothetical protein [uncultured Desulfuromusa sp.]
MVRCNQILCGLLMTFLSVPTVYAQPQETTDIDTITVTAQKREENIQDVPVSMSLFDSMAIEDRMIETIDDIAKYSPGLKVINYGGAIEIRTIHSRIVFRLQHQKFYRRIVYRRGSGD